MQAEGVCARQQGYGPGGASPEHGPHAKEVQDHFPAGEFKEKRILNTFSILTLKFD